MTDRRRGTIIGDRIREARIRAGLTQRQVGALLGVTRQTIWCWETGRMAPNARHLAELSSRLGVSTESLPQDPAVRRHTAQRTAGDASLLSEPG